MTIGGRTYEATFETPAERPDKPWTTLCQVDAEPRSKGSIAAAGTCRSLRPQRNRGRDDGV